jgi:hypothetical protein
MTTVVKSDGWSFDHATGHVGDVTFEFNVDSAVLNGQVLSNEAIEYIVEYGIKQNLTDCYASAKVTAEKKDLVLIDVARDLFARRLRGILDGTLSMRDSLSPKKRIVNEIAMVAFRKLIKMTWKKFVESLDSEEIAQAVFDKFIAENITEFERAADERIEMSKSIKTKTSSISDLLQSVKAEQPVATTVIKGGKGKKVA